MPVSLTQVTTWLSVKMYTIVEHDFCTTCYERPPVLRDRFAGQKEWSPKTGSTVLSLIITLSCFIILLSNMFVFMHSYIVWSNKNVLLLSEEERPYMCFTHVWITILT